MSVLIRPFVVSVIILLLSSCASSPANQAKGGFGLFGSSKIVQNIATPTQVKITNAEQITPSEFESKIIESSFKQLRDRGVKVLDCSYKEDAYKQHFYFWYQSVVYPQSGFAKISPGHPLGGLGDTALNDCPKSQAEANTIQQQNVTKFNELANARLNYLQSLIDNADGRKNENGCLYTYTNEYGALYKNKCDYDLNIVWEVGNPGGHLGLNAQRYFLGRNATLRGSPLKIKHMSGLACYAPMLPINRKKPHVNGRQLYLENSWNCERPSES